MPETPPPTGIIAAVRGHERKMLAIDGVEGIAAGEGAIVLYTRDQSVAERLPGRIDKYPVEIVVTGQIRALWPPPARPLPEVLFIPKGQSLTVDGKTFKGRKYLIDGKPAQASVTTILEHKFGEGKFGAGAWWGQGIGIEGTLALLDNPEVSHVFDKAKTKDDIVPLLIEHKLTTNHTRDRAGDRGKAIHAAAEQYAEHGGLPSPKAYPKEYRGYIEALIKFLDEKQPEFLETEVVVGSAEHDYAGTFDARVKIDGREGIIDYKTSKSIYLANFFQLAAYELASVECGYEPTDFQAVVRLGADGEYEYEESKVTIPQWLDQLGAYRSEIAAKEARKA